MPNKDSKKSERKSLEELFPKIAHEIGNPLTSIISLASILERSSESNSVFPQSIISEAWKINRLVEKTSVYSGNREAIKNNCEIKELITKSIERFFSRASKETKEKGKSISLQIKNEATVSIDEEQIRILIEEALSNAIDYGTVGIDNAPEKLLCIEIDKDEAHLKLSFRNKLPEEKQIHFTNKVGIGLEVIKQIARNHDGLANVKKHDKIFSLEVLLPLGKDSTKKKNEVNAFNWENKSISILLIDDDQNILTVMEKILSYSFTKLLGASECVCYCESADTAMSLIESDIEVDLIICDKNLSSKHEKRDVLEELLAKAPKLKNRSIRISGEAPGAGDSYPFLAKPFSSQDLIAIVKEVLSNA